MRHLLKGERTGSQFRLGDHLRVQVLRASLEDRKIDFRLVPQRGSAAPPVEAPKRAYDYAAAGERYSLPKPRGAGASSAPARDNAGRAAPRKGSKPSGAKATVKPKTTKPQAAKRPGKPKGKR